LDWFKVLEILTAGVTYLPFAERRIALHEKANYLERGNGMEWNRMPVRTHLDNVEGGGSRSVEKGKARRIRKRKKRTGNVMILGRHSA
jgi:hypothetical protein